MRELPHVLILGAGPAGLGAALRLRRLNRARVTVLERGEHVGGNAASFEINGNYVDFGSHRLHPACEPEILDDIRTLLGPDLADRSRHGRIRLRGHCGSCGCSDSPGASRTGRSGSWSTWRG